MRRSRRLAHYLCGHWYPDLWSKASHVSDTPFHVITLIGSYGYYYVEIDGENRRFFNAHSTTDEIPALLFEVKDLDAGDHSAWFMNQQNYGTERSRSCKSWHVDDTDDRYRCRLYRH